MKRVLLQSKDATPKSMPKTCVCTILDGGGGVTKVGQGTQKRELGKKPQKNDFYFFSIRSLFSY